MLDPFTSVPDQSPVLGINTEANAGVIAVAAQESLAPWRPRYSVTSIQLWSYWICNGIPILT